MKADYVRNSKMLSRKKMPETKFGMWVNAEIMA